MIMKKIFFLLAVVAIALSSCGRKGEKDLLQTIPGDTDYFVVVNLKGLSSDLGDEGKHQLDELLDKKGASFDARWKYFFSDDSQVDFSAPLVVFEYNNGILATFYTKDESKFAAGIEACLGEKGTEAGGLYVCADNTVFMDGHQVWFATRYPEVTPSDITRLSGLGEKESVLGMEVTKKVIGKSDDIASVVNLDRALDGAWNRNARIMLNMLFDDASYLVSYTNFEKGKVTNETSFLSYKCEEAKLAFKMSKLDMGTLGKFDGKGNFFAAIGLNPELMRSIVRQMKNFGAVPPEAQEMLGQLDGTSAMSVNFDSKYSDPSFSAMFTFKNKQGAADAASFLRTISDMGSSLSAIPSDRQLFVIQGTQGGESFDSVVGDLKGASLGIVLMKSFFENMGSNNGASYLGPCVIKLKEEGKGVKLGVTMHTPGEANSLVSFLQMVSSL